MGATLEDSMRFIQGAPSAWLAMHLFLALASALFAAAALAMLAARSPLTATFPGLAGWSVLAVSRRPGRCWPGGRRRRS